MLRKLLYTLPLVLLLAGGGLYWQRHGLASGRPEAGAGAGAAAPETVAATVAQTQPWQTTLRATGEVRAVQGADMSAEVSGIVDSISFTSGQDVGAGTVLLRLRANDDEAHLAQLQAAADLANANLARDRRQFDAQAISRATLDADESTLRSDQAQVAAFKAVTVEKIVRAPFAGRIGVRLVDVGQYLTAGTPIVTLQALDPIYVDFNIQQQALSQLQPGLLADVHVDAWPGRVFQAHINSINSRVDSASRMVMVRAQLDNHDHALLPGMFAVVEIRTGTPRPLLTLPQAAISYNPYGDFVYVLQPDPHATVAAGSDRFAGRFTVRTRVVQAGATRGDQVAILRGLQAGEIVVTAGQVKLRDGIQAVVNNVVQPGSEPAPQPVDE
ncbi:efflux RND transporter periplasmic adaptor subunit [Lichenicoccus roseus]|uniref:Efflux RND transporter periplasmic adaptor subunit n=1 Tax=Lichenicoccus roseus TaxID=2683649 RepID=A0A5R9J7S5_9PROT|nr:efflux RND transporter periplasmic adaptor subunit [Lichenicoccus roseus]TLU73670.1 efflux RND transporter periplasmic adaptor subunit [Lichenicoccus roseus]